LPSWQRQFSELLLTLADRGRPVQVALLGIGNELNADDGAGVMVARALHLRWAAHRELLALEAGTAPENLGGPLRRFAPDLVLMVDAVEMGAPAGTVAILDWDRLDGLSASTHTLPLSVLAAYLGSELRCQVVLIGIQAGCLALGQPLSAPAQRAVGEVVEGLAASLT
jgi:hydrogenase 3 maturation protease